MSVKNSKPLHERLLSLLKTETSLHDCLELKCRDTESEPRFAHRTVLIASSAYFRNLLQEKPELVSEDVPFTSDVVDVLIEYLYLDGAITFKNSQAIQLYCAASLFCLDRLRDEIRAHFLFSMDEILQHEGFLVDDTAEDVKRMENILVTAKCDKLSLVQRILRWGKGTTASSDYIVDLLSSALANVSIDAPEESHERRALCGVSRKRGASSSRSSSPASSRQQVTVVKTSDALLIDQNFTAMSSSLIPRMDDDDGVRAPNILKSCMNSESTFRGNGSKKIL